MFARLRLASEFRFLIDGRAIPTCSRHRKGQLEVFHETDLNSLPPGYEASASLRQASAISTRLCLAAIHVSSSSVESVGLLQDRPSQQPSVSVK